MHSSFFSLALLLLSPSLAARADDSPPKPTAPELYKRALGHLNEGLWFEAAIAELTQAVQLDPTNSDYHLALGCAEVDRAGSLGYAACMTDQLFNAQAQYPKDLAAWQAAQNDPNSDGFSDTAPVAPPDMTFQVKDDLHHLTLTGKQAVARVIELGTAAQGEWRQAVQLAPTRQTRAQAESVQGWGLLSERRILQFTDYPEAKVPTAPKPMDAVVAFRSATKDDPDKAAYWEGLGDAYPYSEFDPDTEAPQTSYALDIIRAWQKSLALATGNTGLGFKLYEVQSRHTTENPPLDPKLALETLKTVAASDPGNSLLQYGLAALLFKQTHYSDVRDRVDPTTINSDQPTTK
jgi:tetratricopeptide (TPR) repeat protein